MSGPKDYVIVFSALRLAEIAARRAAEEQARASARRLRQQQTREQLDRMQQTAAEQRAVAAQKAMESVHAELDALRRQHASRRSQAEQASAPQAEHQRPKSDEALLAQLESARSALAVVDDAIDCSNDAVRRGMEEEVRALAGATDDAEAPRRVKQLLESAQRLAGNAQRLAPRWHEGLSALQACEQDLVADTAVAQFVSAGSEQWRKVAESFRAAPQVLADWEQRLTELEQHVSAGQELLRQAAELQSKFHTRNELLADVIASLQEIGFFVSDPQYQDARDPAGAVIVKATRGSESISTVVDLSETVRTTWNGQTDEGCAESFFDYVDRMNQKGVGISALRDDLRARPKLREAGAKELPDTSQRHQGG